MKIIYSFSAVLLLTISVYAQYGQPQAFQDTLFIKTTTILPEIEYANLNIIATNTIEPGITKFNAAGQSILLKQDFHAKQDSFYRGYIEQTNKSSSLVANNTATTQAISVWPNPADDILNITSYTGIIEFSLITMDGKTIIKSGISKQNNCNIPLFGISPGCYIINITTDDLKTNSFKLIKN